MRACVRACACARERVRVQCYKEYLAISRKVGDQKAEALACNSIGVAYQVRARARARARPCVYAPVRVRVYVRV